MSELQPVCWGFLTSPELLAYNTGHGLSGSKRSPASREKLHSLLYTEAPTPFFLTFG